MEKSESMVEIVGLKRYRSGYTGFMIESGNYVHFLFNNKEEVIRLKSYPVKDFICPDQFVGNMSKFFPTRMFFRKPAPIEELTRKELERVYPGARKR